MNITRQKIIKILKTELVKKPAVFALWLEGADAHKRFDKYSDIDIWIDVEDKHIGKTFNVIKEILAKLSPLDYFYEVNHPHPKIHQAFFHLQDSSEFLVIDICIQKHSRNFWYTKGYKDEKVKILFDKKKVIKYKPLSKTIFNKEIKLRIDELIKTFYFFQIWVKKGINRKKYLEALSYYHEFILHPLVELIRIKYEPTKKDFYLKHLDLDLPEETVKQIEDLFKVRSIIEIKKKMKIANELFNYIIKNL
jgi:hypothetical protein